MKDCLKSIANAQAMFSPRKLISRDVLYRKDDIVIVDRGKIVKSEEEETAFSIVLHIDYKFHYDTKDSVTVFFSMGDDAIYGGVYDLTTSKCLTRCVIANSQSTYNTDTTYIYTSDDYKIFENIINMA